jgi:hypothetical protein
MGLEANGFLEAGGKVGPVWTALGFALGLFSALAMKFLQKFSRKKVFLSF